MTLDKKLEAILFFRGEPVSMKKLAEMAEVKPEEVKVGLAWLKKRLENGALTLILKDDEVLLSTAPELSSLIENLVKDELSKDLGKAGLETLSIILYRGPISRRDIDYIRGVNSTFIIRNLLVRGLVEKVASEKDQRTYLYKPTFELLSYLGTTSIQELPEYAKVQEEITSFVKKEEALEEETK